MFSSNQKISSRALTYLPFLLVGIFWIYTLLAVPTFDLDESLYRRAAEEMKLHGSWWNPTWDGVPLYHKPPILYWLIIICSYIVDGAHAGVSSLAARLPSFFSSIGILIALYRASPTLKWTAPLLYLSAFFPVLTGTAVIFDPLQTLVLLPSLFIFTKYFKTAEMRTRDLVIAALSIFSATAIKGLNGIIIPAVAVGLHSVFVLIHDRSKIKALLVQSLKVFLPAAALSLLYYFFLDYKMGRGFTEEFFLVHHFGRSQNAMEAHGGPLFYHPVFVWISGCFLGLFLLPKILVKNWGFLKIGFPLTYVLSFILVFSFSATKLPHYTWPIWAALAFQGALLQDVQSANSPTLKKFSNFFTLVPLLFLGFIFLILSANPLRWAVQFIHSEQVLAVLKYFPEFTATSQTLFTVGAGLCLFAWFDRSVKEKPSYLANINLLCCLILGITIGPKVNALLFEPQTQIAKAILEKNPTKEDCIYYAGPHSPSISLTLGNDIFHNRCKEGQALKYLVVPEWKLPECKERGFVALAQAKYLYLCGNGSSI